MVQKGNHSGLYLMFCACWLDFSSYLAILGKSLDAVAARYAGSFLSPVQALPALDSRS
jgi:hypothetical protein